MEPLDNPLALTLATPAMLPIPVGWLPEPVPSNAAISRTVAARAASTFRSTPSSSGELSSAISLEYSVRTAIFLGTAVPELKPGSEAVIVPPSGYQPTVASDDNCG